MLPFTGRPGASSCPPDLLPRNAVHGNHMSESASRSCGSFGRLARACMDHGQGAIFEAPEPESMKAARRWKRPPFQERVMTSALRGGVLDHPGIPTGLKPQRLRPNWTELNCQPSGSIPVSATNSSYGFRGRRTSPPSRGTGCCGRANGRRRGSGASGNADLPGWGFVDSWRPQAPRRRRDRRH
jgi:hypothetical protein